MAPAAAAHRISRQDYLQAELASEFRHEFGARNFMRAAGNPLAGNSCFPIGSDFKLMVPRGGEEEF